MSTDISNNEILEAVSKGFSAVEKKIEKSEQALREELGMKIDGVRNSLDSEIIRRTDEFGVLRRRISYLESLHNIEAEEHTTRK